MDNFENPITNNLKKELHRFGEGLQTLYNTVENGFLELEETLTHAKHLHPINNQAKISSKKLLDQK